MTMAQTYATLPRVAQLKMANITTYNDGNPRKEKLNRNMRYKMNNIILFTIRILVNAITELLECHIIKYIMTRQLTQLLYEKTVKKQKTSSKICCLEKRSILKRSRI